MNRNLLKAAITTALVSGTFLAVSANAATPVAHNVANPYSPAYNAPWRHGVIPTLNVHAAMKRWEAAHRSTLATSEQTLSKGASVAGVGTMNGQNKVYLVFYGTQWGTASTDANGNLKFTNDSAGAAGAAQQMFKGIGNGGETWQNELTQWCDGAATGATSCAAGIPRIPRQVNILAGVWYDNSAASPSAATAAQLAAEANKAAGHFGNTTTAANRLAYYVILSPKGTNPDNYQGQYCAWHDYTSGSNGNMAYSNQPYNIDSGAGCGVGFVNSPGTLDGFTMTLGHEWHEMMSDQFPSGGWSNHGSGTHSGQENSDECAWIAAGSAGGAANVSFGTFGTYAEQASWSNDTNNCAISHTDVSGGTGGNQAPVANFSYSTSGLTANFTDSSTDDVGVTSRSWTFGDGGTSTATNPSHTYASANTYSVKLTVTDGGGLTGSKTSSVTVGTTPPPLQLLGNTGFESGNTVWTASSGVIDNGTSEAAHAGSWKAWMDGYGSTHTDTLSQTVTVPSGHGSGTLAFYLHIDTAETTTTSQYDKLTVALYSGSTLVRTLATYSNLNKNTGYALRSLALTSADLAHSSLTVKFTGTEDSSLQTSFVVDDVTLTAN